MFDPEVIFIIESKVEDISPEDVAAFAKDLKKHWKDIKSELAPKAKKIVKKISKK